MPTTNTNSAALVLPDPADATNAAATGEVFDIRDIKGAVDIPSGNEWVYWLLGALALLTICLLYTSPSPRDATLSRMPSSA